MISSFYVRPGDKRVFCWNSPRDFGLFLGAIIIACVAVITFIFKQFMSKRNQTEQLMHQQNMMSEHFSHQREMAYREYFLDKRTSAMLDFQKNLEETKADITYFFSEPANLERRTTFGLRYLNDEEPRWEGNVDPEWYYWVHVERLVEKIDYLQHFIIGNLKGLKSPRDNNIFMFVHTGGPMTNMLEGINAFHNDTRGFSEKYLYVHKLDAWFYKSILLKTQSKCQRNRWKSFEFKGEFFRPLFILSD